jgi:hypothetical protein
MNGTLQQTSNGSDHTTITIAGTLSGAVRASLRVVLAGTALGSGGLAMQTSRATLGPTSQPDRYQGQVVALDGTNISARVNDAAGRAFVLAMQLTIDPNSNAVTGSVSAHAGGN